MSEPIRVTAGSEPEIGWPVQGREFTGALINPTAQALTFRFPTTTDYSGASPVSGTWVTDTSSSSPYYPDPTYWATVEIALSAGTYYIFALWGDEVFHLGQLIVSLP